MYRGFLRVDRYRLRHTLYAGGMSATITRELLERGHAAAVLPYDPQRDEVVLIEQFRIGALRVADGPWLVEIIAGVIDEGERAEEMIHREAEEEAGCRLLAVEPICHYLVSPGGASETISLFCGRVDASDIGGLHGLEHEGEDIRAFTLPFDAAWQMLQKGQINSASPIIAMQWLAMNRERLRREWAEKA